MLYEDARQSGILKALSITCEFDASFRIHERNIVQLGQCTFVSGFLPYRNQMGRYSYTTNKKAADLSIMPL
jgi:hypothetical protein